MQWCYFIILFGWVGLGSVRRLVSSRANDSRLRSFYHVNACRWNARSYTKCLLPAIQFDWSNDIVAVLWFKKTSGRYISPRLHYGTGKENRWVRTCAVHYLRGHGYSSHLPMPPSRWLARFGPQRVSCYHTLLYDAVEGVVHSNTLTGGESGFMANRETTLIVCDDKSNYIHLCCAFEWKWHHFRMLRFEDIHSNRRSTWRNTRQHRFAILHYFSFVSISTT